MPAPTGLPDPAPPVASAESGQRANSSSVSGNVITVQSTEGTFRLDVAARTFRRNSGPVIRLTRQATDSVRALLVQVVSGDAAAAVAGAVPPPPGPTPPACNPNVQNCGGQVFEPNRVPDRGGARGEAGAASGTYSSVLTVGQGGPPWSCLDISRTIYALQPNYAPARAWYTAALKSFTDAVEQLAIAAAGGDVPFSASFRAAYATANLQAARSVHDYWALRLGVLASLFNANACLYRAWDPAPAPVQTGTAGGGGASSPGGGSYTIKCYYIVTYDGMTEIGREVTECRTEQAL